MICNSCGLTKDKKFITTAEKLQSKSNSLSSCPIKSCLKKRSSIPPSPPPPTISQSNSSNSSSTSTSTSSLLFSSPETILAQCDESLAKLRLTFTDGLIDDYIVGDRVWVDGNKPGYIQFIGEVHFADGDWAGVVLDDALGKNAGSVSGRRYFYCEPKRGLFCRLGRLSRYPYSFGKSTPDSGISGDNEGDPIAKGLRRQFKSTNSFSRGGSPSRSLSSDRSRSLSRSVSRSPESSRWLSSYSETMHHDPRCPSALSSSTRRTVSPKRHRSVSPLSRYNWVNDEDLNDIMHDDYNYDTKTSKVYSYTLPRKPASTFTTVSTVTTTVDGQYKPGPLRLGDKVFVNSSKGLLTGRLRFLGTTHFAPGQWAGVELDEPHGKNDGQVAGKRYFTCRSRYGLFAPAYKVVKADPNRMTTVTKTIRNGPKF
ncbi:CAP-Gly domain-containing linker protein 1 isoform X1 [Tetranychus urticae]|uniref:CAP-Gly domain-containing linker protein 1 isoform X1 n=1 Tax=Tetranychus urticae TaxID=32264 RepID=UPI000D64DDEE|nr:CAP-Gly domain-containing linker protein 1 isoform X1 [Tetranychus urticae]